MRIGTITSTVLAVAAVAVSAAPAGAQVVISQQAIEENRVAALIAGDGSGTRSFQVLGLQSDINALATSFGLYSTRLEVPIGCQYELNGPRNNLTAADLVKLYGDVEKLRSLDAEGRYLFFDHMNLFTQQPEFRAIIEQEGQSLGVSQAERDRLWTGMRNNSKGGRYNLNRSGTIRVTNTVGGAMRIPFQSYSGRVYNRSYAYAEFIVEGTASSGQDTAFNTTSIEMFPMPIRQALRSFRDN